MALLRTLFVVALVAALVGAVLILTDLPVLAPLGGAAFALGWFLLLLGAVALVAFLVRRAALGGEGRRGGRFT